MNTADGAHWNKIVGEHSRIVVGEFVWEPESTVVGEWWSTLAPQLWWEHFHNFVVALVGTAVEALLSTAHVGLVGIGISVLGLVRSGSFLWALVGNSVEEPVGIPEMGLVGSFLLVLLHRLLSGLVCILVWVLFHIFAESQGRMIDVEPCCILV